MARPKADTSKSERDKSPNKNSKSTPSSSRTFRKSPARAAKAKSPSRAGNPSPSSPSGRGPIGRSPSRRSPSRRSPGRKSPGRISPARKPPTPGRRSPGRQPREKADSEKAKSPGRPRRHVVEVDSDSDNAELNRRLNVEKPKAAVRGRARRLDSDYTSPKVILQDIQTLTDVGPADREISSYVGLVRRSFRKSQSREVDRIVHLKPNDSAVKKLTEFSDDDDVPVLTRSSLVREKSERYSEPKVIEERVPKPEFGGWIGALILILSLPPFIAYLCAFCNKTQCSFIKLPNFQYKNVSSYVDTTAFLIFSGFLLLMATLTALPFGGSKVSGLPNKQGKLNYVTNGVFATVVTASVVVALEFFKVPVTSYIIANYFQLVISSIILGILFSIYLYIRSFFVPVSALNPYAITNSRIYNFWVGREVNPRPLRVIDTKLFLLKVFSVGTIILNGAYVYKSLVVPPKSAEGNTTINLSDCNPTLLLIATLQTLYAFDFVLFEYAFLVSFEIQQEAVGYMSSVLGFTAPFLPVLFTKYIYEYGIRLPAWQLAAAAVLFCIGFFLYRRSNLQKYAFRQNPYSPALSHLESIPTSQGKKLLVSGYWGFVRHPNYLGDILIWLSFALFAWNAVPAIVSYGDVVFLLYRAHRDGARCKQRYGSAWDRYCQRVKYVLIPKIY